MTPKNSSRARAFFELTISTIIAFSVLRLAFLIAFHPGTTAASSGDAITVGQVVHSFWIGLRFDARVAILLALPILLVSLIPWFHWRHSIAHKIWTAVYTVVYAGVTLIFLCDFGYYAYLESRINVTVLHFLNNPRTSWGMINETYHAWVLILVWLAIAVGYWVYFSRRIFARSTEGDGKPSSTEHTAPSANSHPVVWRWSRGVVLTALVLFGMWGKADQYPLRWSDAFYTQNMFLAYLAMNPIHYFLDSINSRNQTFSTKQTRAHYDEMADYLGIPPKDRDQKTLSYARPVEPTPADVNGADLHLQGVNGRPPNIIYMVEESLASYKTGLFGNSPEATPNIDRIAQQGWLFRNYFTPTEGTARSVFCVLSGIPDIDAKSTSSRNPLLVSQHTLINSLKGYDKFYFIGGSATWGNIRGVWMNNVKGLKMYEGDTNLPGPRTDVWGLSDLDLFRAAAKVLAAHDPNKPFFALIQSASFHRPYTIPKDHGTLQIQHLTPSEIQKYGLKSNAEWNSLRFADYSVGQFFKIIKTDPFFKNTIVIIHGDHGLPHHDAPNLTEGEKFYGINRFHVPLIVSSPLIKAPHVFHRMMSETDVWPTILGTLGVSGTNTTMGRNVFAIPKGTPHYAFSYVYYDNPLRLFLYDQKYLISATPAGAVGLYAYRGDKPKENLKDSDPERFKKMSNMLQGVFETSRYMLYHNHEKASQLP